LETHLPSGYLLDAAVDAPSNRRAMKLTIPVLTVVALSSIGFLSTNAQDTSARIPARPNWEYQILDLDAIAKIRGEHPDWTVERVLTLQGAQGWELVALDNTVGPSFYFKRQK
jgi:hypothetical protein